MPGNVIAHMNLMKTGSPHYLVTPTALAFALSACAGPVAPSALAPVPPASSSRAVAPASSSRTVSNPMAVLAPVRVVTPFSLQAGSFTLSLRAPDGSSGTVKGTYTGLAVAAVPGNTTATLAFVITETSGIGSAVTGLRASGAGAFVGEGAFTLSLTLESSTSKAVDGLKTMLRGTSRVSCSASHLIVVTQHGTQSTPKFLEMTIDLQHQVAETGC